MENQLLTTFGYEFLPVVVGSAFMPGFVALTYCLSHDGSASVLERFENGKVLYFSLYALALLGTITGQITAQSREPAVSAVMPAVLSLVGGISIYIFSSEDKQRQIQSSVLIVVFTLHLLGGMYYGRELRKSSMDYDAQYSAIMINEMAKNQAALDMLEFEENLRLMRKLLGLPPLEDVNISVKN